MAPADMQALVEALPAKDAALQQTGKLVWNGSLQRPKATYAEAREMVGGFFVIEAADREEAIRIASLHPAATLGEHMGWGIEVHPIGTCSAKTQNSRGFGF